MKLVYIIYASIPNRLWEAKLKYIINESSYVLSGKEYNYDGNNRTFIYAWTTKEKYLNAFKYFRENALKNIYKIEKVEMDKIEYGQFVERYKNERLRYIEIPTNDNEMYGTNDFTKILCTLNEADYTIDEGHVYLYDYFSDIIKVDYSIFDKKYINALDCLAYCDEFNILRYHICSSSSYYDELYTERYEMSEYNHSFNLTGFGNHKMIDLYANRFAIFVNLFYEMIEGYNKKEEIKLAREV